MPLKEDMAKLLDKCILLNTYLKYYFKPMNYITKYDICYQVNCYQDKQNMYLEAQKINFDNFNASPFIASPFNASLDDALFINELVHINTEAEDREPDLDFSYHTYCRYDYTYTKLAKNLEKEVSGK